MALTDEQIEEIFLDHGWHWNGSAKAYMPAARDIEAEVRKDDEALIRQLVAALSLPCDRWNGTQSRIVREAIDAANAWLEAKK